MRGRFAMRFGDGKNDGGAEPTRADRVRSAFNSPFWPFVLATTSIPKLSTILRRLRFVAERGRGD